MTDLINITDNTVEVWRHIDDSWQTARDLHVLMTEEAPRVSISIKNVRLQINKMVEAGVVERRATWGSPAEYRVAEIRGHSPSLDLLCHLNELMDETGGDYPYGKGSKFRGVGQTSGMMNAQG